MIGIKIGTEFLDLLPGTGIQWDRENPLLEFNEEILGEYSYPFTVLASPKNLRLLNYAGLMEKRISNIGIDAVVLDNGIQVLRGKIKIEKSDINLNRIQDGQISCYFLSGSSSFYQDIKDVKLRDINVGGARSFDWDDYATSGTGFWGHVRTVMLASPGYGVSGYDYAFFPVINKSWPGKVDGADMMNKVYLDTGNFFLSTQLTTFNRDPNRIVPFPYLKYVLQKAVEHVGWRIQGNIMDDDDFKKIVMINYRAIDWSYVKRAITYFIVPRNPVVFNLQDHLPDITISRLLIALKNRFGWWYDFDRKTKTIRISELQTTATGNIKEMTLKASPVIPKPINQESKVYALRNIFSTEIGSGAPNFDQVALQGNVDELTDLPAADEVLYGHVYLVISENNYYICQQNDDTEAWEWVLYAYNIYDYEPENRNEDINTEATTIGVEKYSDYLDLVPRADNQGMWLGTLDEISSWGVELCFNHGVRDNKNGDPYPYGSSHVYDSEFNQIAYWALTFECKLIGGGSDVGLYVRQWKRLLSLLNSPEEADVKLSLSRHEYLALRFSDILVIRNVRFLIKTMKPSLPFTGEVELRLVRI